MQLEGIVPANPFSRLWSALTGQRSAPAAAVPPAPPANAPDTSAATASPNAASPVTPSTLPAPTAPASPPPALDADPAAVAPALEALFNATSWDATHAILDREQALLLTDTADLLLERSIASLREEGDERQASYVNLHRTLLHRAREIGVAAAWAEFELQRQAEASTLGESNGEQDEARIELTRVDVERAITDAAFLAEQFGLAVDDPQIPALQQQLRGLLAGERKPNQQEQYDADPAAVARALEAFLNAPSWDEAQAVLEREQALLLTRTADLLLEENIQSMRESGDEQRANYLAAQRILLLRVRQIGLHRAWAEFEAALRSESTSTGSAPPTIPASLQSLLLEIVSIERPQEMPRKIALLQEAIQRADAGEGDPLVKAALLDELGNALNADPRGNRRENLEQAIACYQEALRVYTLADFPQDYAATQNNLGLTYGDRIAGTRRDNLEQAIACYQQALRVRTLADFPVDFRDTQLNLAWLALDALATEARAAGDKAGAREGYRRASDAYAAARRAHAELGWLESDAQGRTSLQGEHHPIKEMYVRHAWCLWQLGDARGAVVALEAGRAQALAEAQAVAGVALDGVCVEHTAAFRAARADLQVALTTGDRNAKRTARDAFLAVRSAIRAHCQPTFLPSEPEYADIARAAAPGQALVYLAATDWGGMAFVIPSTAGDARAEHTASGDTDERLPLALALPALTWAAVDNWLVRRDANRHVVGGFQLAVQHLGVDLLDYWLQRMGDDGDEEAQQRLLALPLREVEAALPPVLTTLRDAFERLVTSWRDEADLLSGGTAEQQATATALRARLAVPLGEALATGVLDGELGWFFQEAELDALLPQLSSVILQPLHDYLVTLGLGGADQPVALIACGRLGALPLHAAEVLDARTGKRLPFQETCELTYQASARTLTVSRAAAQALPARGPFFAVGDPQRTTAHPLPWAEAEADAIVTLARKAGRGASAALLTTEATRRAVLDLLRAIATQHRGALVEVASHGHADPANPHNCFMLLASNERLTLADLQRERLLDGVRCFNASGCVTGLGDLETAPDELSSFAAGVLQAGAASAIATQWFVNDRATFLLMLQFARALLSDDAITPARALRQAGQWLRTATWRDIDDLARQGMRRMRPTVARDAGSAAPPQYGEYTDDAWRDALRGIVTSDSTSDVTSDALPADTTDDATDLPDGLRFAPDDALKYLRSTVAVDRSKAMPFAHPIYWACAVVYGA